MGRKLPKMSAQKVMYVAAAQIVLTTVGFIFLKRPYLWAWQALEWYNNIYCGSELNAVLAKYQTYPAEHKNQIRAQVEAYQEDCLGNYLDAFTEKYTKACMDGYTSAFLGIPLASCFLIFGIVAALQYAPFNNRTLKKPGFVFAFFFSLILLSINLGQMITIVIPLINPNASPNGIHSSNLRDKCGYAAEFMSLVLIVVSTILSSFIAAYVIQLYVKRAEYQDDNVSDIRMDAGGELAEEFGSRVAPKTEPRGGGSKKKSPPMAGQTGHPGYSRQQASSGYPSGFG